MVSQLKRAFSFSSPASDPSWTATPEYDQAGLANAVSALCAGETPSWPEGTSPELIQALTAMKEARLKASTRCLGAVIQSSMDAAHAQADLSRVYNFASETENEARAMAAAIEELNASINQIADTADRSSLSLNSAVSRASQSAQGVRQTTEAMARVTVSLDQVNHQVEDLREASDQIGGIVNAIEQIASQTNLLALNATIEAARAGEAGRGFAVVASEVKALSMQTARSTDEVKSRIGRLEAAVAAIRKSLDEAHSLANESRSLADTANAGVQEATDLVEDSARTVSVIAQILGEQTAATGELTRGVTRVAENSTHTQTAVDTVVTAVVRSEKSLGITLSELEQEQIPDFVLYRAKVDHILWKKRLATLLSGRESLNANELSDHHACRLGKWYTSAKASPLGRHPAFISLEAPHQKVHVEGKKAAELYKSGDKAGAEAAFERMVEASGHVVEGLDQLIRAAADSRRAGTAG
ncbi:MAG: methyl-accepting chemotaxis protein [Asticcacaulis sp.]